MGRAARRRLPQATCVRRRPGRAVPEAAVADRPARARGAAARRAFRRWTPLLDRARGAAQREPRRPRRALARPPPRSAAVVIVALACAAVPAHARARARGDWAQPAVAATRHRHASSPPTARTRRSRACSTSGCAPELALGAELRVVPADAVATACRRSSAASTSPSCRARGRGSCYAIACGCQLHPRRPRAHAARRAASSLTVDVRAAADGRPAARGSKTRAMPEALGAAHRRSWPARHPPPARPTARLRPMTRRACARLSPACAGARRRSYAEGLGHAAPLRRRRRASLARGGARRRSAAAARLGRARRGLASAAAISSASAKPRGRRSIAPAPCRASRACGSKRSMREAMTASGPQADRALPLAGHRSSPTTSTTACAWPTRRWPRGDVAGGQATLARLATLPPPDGKDPRIDLVPRARAGAHPEPRRRAAHPRRRAAVARRPRRPAAALRAHPPSPSARALDSRARAHRRRASPPAPTPSALFAEAGDCARRRPRHARDGGACSCAPNAIGDADIHASSARSTPIAPSAARPASGLAHAQPRHRLYQARRQAARGQAA